MEKPGDKGLSATDLVGLLADAEWMYRPWTRGAFLLASREHACLDDYFRRRVRQGH